MPEFTNDALDLGDIPVLTEENFVPVDANYLRVALIGKAVSAVVIAVVGIVVAIVVPSSAWIPLLVSAVLLVLTALLAWLNILEVRHMAYQVRQHDLSYRHGVVVKTVSTVPFTRVQHARVRQGPIQRRFGIASVEVNSAGPDLQIHGLATDDANTLKALVVERSDVASSDD